MTNKRISVITLIAGAFMMVAGLVYPFIRLYLSTLQKPIAIIGGADMPIFKHLYMLCWSGWPMVVTFLGGAITLTALFSLIFKNTVKQHCSVKTTVLALSLSAVGGLGLTCVMNAALLSNGNHPVRYPFMVCLGLLSFVAFVALIIAYLFARKQNRSLKGFVLDALTSIIYLPGFFFLIAMMFETVRSIIG